MTQHVRVGAARRTGTETPCADAYSVVRTGDRVTATVVDGAGHAPDTIRFVNAAAETITLLGPDVGGLAALVTAGRMARAFPEPRPHASALCVQTLPGEPTLVHWIGDCSVHGWDGRELRPYSTPQTMGEYLRTYSGVPVEVLDRFDDWPRYGLAQAMETTCLEAEIPEDVHLVMLCTDGVSGQVEPALWRQLCAKHGDDPQSLADALVAAAAPDSDGYRDDATVVVLRLHTEKAATGESAEEDAS
nr:hypothetical protein KPHV_86530 [Kitasatospora purpeofusca]